MSFNFQINANNVPFSFRIEPDNEFYDGEKDNDISDPVDSKN